MRVSIKGKLPLLLVGVVLLSMTWLGYWIGYMTYRSHINKLQEQLDGLLPTNSHQAHTGAAHIHRKEEVSEEEAPLHRVRNFGETKGDNVYVIGNAKPNEAINRVDMVDSKKHAIGLHEGQANKISQHLNSVRASETRIDSIRGGRNAGLGGDSSNVNRQGNPFRTRGETSNVQTNTGLSNGPWGNKPFKEQHTNQLNPNNVAKSQAGSVLSDRHMKSQKEVVDQAAIDEFQELRKRLHANIHSEITTPKPVFRDVFHEVDTFGKYYALRHSGEATKVHGELHANLRGIPDLVPPETYTFKAKRLPKNPRFRPSVANGHIGTAVHSAEVFMNGVYCGRGGESHRAVIPSTASFNITGTQPPTNYTRTYVLNTGDGVYSEETVSETYSVTQRIYAHRKYSRLLVVEVDLVRQSLKVPIKLMIKLNRWASSSDITFLAQDSGKPEVSYKYGHINSPETDTSTRSEVHVYYDHVPNELIPTKGAVRTKWVFLTSIASTKAEALEAYELGEKLVKSNDELYAEHVRTWGTVWSAGRVDVVGNLPLGQAIYGAYYYILSSMPLSEDPTSPFIGLSPSGLPFGDLGMDYQGHVFWDQEVWMYPAILPLWPSLGRLLLGTRRRTMDAAAQNAKLNKHQGLQFPWESALTGGEVCPEAIYSKEEIHISGDISWAILQYIYATNDTSIIKEEQRFGHILTGIANFFVSVLKWNDTRSFYEIRGVVPPDEHHPNINNSAYTNAIAKIALMAPEIVFRRANKTLNNFAHIAKDIYMPYSIKKKYHPEFDGYTEGTIVKQADVILLGYPLNVDMDILVRRNDLKKYEKATNISGPAMSWAMFTIGWLDVGDEARAESMFRRNFQYIKNEFQVWHEVLFGKGATNFITGMGGFLQSVLYGYGGLRFHSDRLDLNPTLPLDCTELHLSGVNYLGSSLNIFIQKDSIVVSLVARTEVAPNLVLWIYKTEEIHTLEMNHSVRIPRQRAAITTTGTNQA